MKAIKVLLSLIAIFMVAVVLYYWFLKARLVSHTNRLQKTIGEYVADAYSAEAQTELQKLAFLEHQFRERNGAFTTDLVAIGWKPWSKKRSYKIGFVRASHPTPNSPRPEQMSSDVLAANDPNEPVGFSLQDVARKCSECSADQNHFKAIAVGKLPDRVGFDIWTIDTTGRPVQLRK